MRNSTRYILYLLFAGAFFFCSNTVKGQAATVDFDNTKDACDGLSNGSITLTVTNGTGPFSYNLLRLVDFTVIANNVPLTLGVPTNITNLAVSDYFIQINDGSPAANFSTTFEIFDVTTPLSGTNTPTDNSSCIAPNGSIILTPAGGSGFGYTFQWQKNGVNYATSKDINNLNAGSYTVTIFDDSTNCSVLVGPIVIDDPSPVIQTITNTPNPFPVCVGEDLVINLSGSEPAPVVYEVINSTTSTPTGVTQLGTGGPLSFTLPSGTFSDGQTFIVRATNQLCTPADMAGAVQVDIVPLPVPTIAGDNSVCAGASEVYNTEPGQSNYVWAVSAGGTITSGGGPTESSITITWNTAGARTVSVNYEDVNGCAALAPTIFNVTVNPAPVLVTPQAKTICTGDNTAYEILLTPANFPAGTTFSWPDPDGAGPATAGVNVPMGTAGTTHINDVLTNLTANPVNVTYVITPTSGAGCPGTPQNVVITISPRPVLVTPQAKTICSGENAAYEILLNPANLPTGTLFNWPDPDGAGPATAGVNVPMGTAGTTHINDVLTNVTGAPVNVTYVITPSAGGCSGTPQNVVITVNPAPVLLVPQNKTICTGENTAYEILLTPANLPVGTLFSWPDPDGAGPATAGVNVPMGTAGTTHINDVLTNATTNPINVTYVVTPTSGSGCPGTPQNVVITVNPRPVLVTPQSKTICSGDNTAYEILLNPANLPAGTVFNWPDPDGAGPATAGVNVPMGTAGTTHINDVLTNTTSSATTVTYVITPSIGGSCPGTARNVVITVNPRPVLLTPQAKTICSGDNTAYEILLNPANLPAGTVFNWPDPDGAGPATAGVNVPMGTAGTTHINNVLTNATSAPITVTYVVTPSLGGACPGIPQNVVITINPRPVLVVGQTKAICSGDNTAYEILLNPANLPTGTVFNWPDPDGAGPATAGVNVPMGTAGTTHINNVLTNATSAPTIVTYVVTPSLGGSCPGTPQNVVITVNPRPVLVTPQAKTICSGDNTAYEILLNPANLPTGTVFSWPDPDGAGPATAGVNVPMGAAGTTHINDVLTNATSSAITVTYVITPSIAGLCPGTPRNVVITVNPRPVLVTPQAKTICSGDNTAYEILLNPANLPTGTVFNWPDPDGAGPATAGVNVLMGTAGTTHINDVLTNLTASPVNVTYVITPSIAGLCAGTPQNVVITVSPRPVLLTSQAMTICSGDNTAYEILLSPVNLPTGTLFSWPDPDGAGPATAGVNVPMGTAGTTHINDVLTNVTGAPITVTYVITPSAGGCAGTPQNVVITVNPAPALVTPQSKIICSGENTAYEIQLTPANLPAGTLFSWPDPDGAGPATAGVNVPMGTAGTTHINDVLTNATSSAITVTYVITPTSGLGCPGTPRNVVITVNPLPVLVTSQAKDICSGDNTAYEILLNPANLPTGTVFSWPDPDGAGPATAGVNVPMGTAGTTHINDVLTNTTSAATTVTYVITPSLGGSCAGTPQNVVITVNPRPVLVTPQAKTICSGDNTAYEILLNPANLPTGTLFNWPDPDGAGPATAGVNVPMGTAGTTHINDVLTNTTSTTITVTYVITPSGAGLCNGVPQNVVITVAPSPDAGADNAVQACNSETAFNLFSNLGGTPDTGGIWLDTDGTGATITGNTVDLSGLAAGAYDFEYVITATAPCVNDTSVVTVNVIQAADAGIDNTVPACNTNNAFNLFTNLLGSPDTGGSWTDVDLTGAAITGNVIDFTGVPVGTYDFMYIVPGTVPCGNDTAVVTVNVIDTAPDAGLDNTLPVCNSETAFNLFIALGGTPDTGGTWTDLDGSGAPITGNIIDLSGLAAGSYDFQYDLAVVGCGSDNAVVTLTVVDGVNAGLDNTDLVCSTVTTYDLFANLLGTPDAGGTWVDADLSGAPITGNVADFAGVAPGTYEFQYVLAASAPCVNDTARLVITIGNSPDAGLDNAVTACNNDTSFDLFASVGGTPDTGGSWRDVNSSGATITGNNADFSAVTPGTYAFEYIITGVAPCVNDTSVVSVTIEIPPNAGTDNAVNVCSSETAYDLFTTLLGTPDTGGSWIDVNSSGGVLTGNTINLNAVAAGSYEFDYIVTGTVCANDTATVTLTVIVAPDAGIDDAETACNTNNAFDLLVALDGTPDSGGNWADLNGSGGIITGNTIDLTGVAVGIYDFRYVVTGALPCANDTSVLTLNVIDTTPDGGADSTVSLCNSEVAFNLFNSISGSPDPGGSWFDLDVSGAVITGDLVNLTTLSTGTYRYRYDLTVAGCGSSSSIVTVNITEGVDAGLDSTVTVCNAENAFDLFASVGGTPDAGGNWVDVNTSGAIITGNNADFTGVTVGTYQFEYVMAATAPCVNDTSVVTVDVTPIPNAGSDSTVVACNSENAYDLFDQIGGTPDAGGTWFDASTSGAPITGNLINLTSLAAGTYNFDYIVAGTAPCGNDTATVAITIEDRPDAGNDATANACNSETAFNLFSRLGGTPDVGGTWFDVDGSGGVITANNINLSGVVAGTYEFEYVVTGTICANDTATVTITITNGPSIAQAGPDQLICSVPFTNLNAVPVTSGTGTWVPVTSGGFVTNVNDPTSQFIGALGNAYMLRWIVTSGSCPPSIDTVIVNFAAAPAVTSPITACVNTAIPTLTANAVGATSFNWYIGTGAGRTLIASTAVGSFTPTAAQINMSTPGSVSFEVTAVYSCGESIGSPIVVNVSNTGSCGGGGGGIDCGAGFTILIDQTLSQRPTCASGSNDGVVALNVSGTMGGNFSVALLLGGTPVKPVQIAPAGVFVFDELSPGSYDYRVASLTTGDTCIQTFDWLVRTTVEATADQMVNATCFGAATGQARITITSGGNSPYEYSINGVDWSDPFISGDIIDDLPPNGTYNILVRDDASDVCPAEVEVTIVSDNPEITSTFNTTPATCTANDGTIINIAATMGGDPTGPFEFFVDGNQVDASNSVTGLSPRNYDLVVVHTGTGCTDTTTFQIMPTNGIGFTVDSDPADCSQDGRSGTLTVIYDNPGDYLVGVSTSQFVEPEYEDDPSNNIQFPFNSLPRGTYFIWAKTKTSDCPTISGPHSIDGVFAVSFDLETTCDDNKLSLVLTHITGELSFGAGTLVLEVRKKFTTTPIVQNFYEPDVVQEDDSIIVLSYDEFPAFLQTPGDYEIRLSQNQIFAPCAEVRSPFVDYEVSTPLIAFVGPVKESYPDILNGSMDIINFSGGSEPYQIKIELVDPAVPGQSYETNWELVEKNSNLENEVKYKNIPAGRYEVLVQDDNGCVLELDPPGIVPLDTDLYIPNIFTPNGDDKNDVFFIRNLPDGGAELVISNRWGTQVYSTKNYQNNWDAEDVSDGIYFFKLKIADGNPISGWVEVLRGERP